MADGQASTALTKRNAETALMPPPPLPKRIKRPSKVLDEDVYTDALSHIIARDFFPGLLETQAQHEYLDALDSNDNDWIRDAGRKLHQTMTPGPGRRGRRGTSMAQTPRQTPSRRPSSATPQSWRGETPRCTTSTPSAADSHSHGRPRQPEVDTSLSLGAFQAKYTSEDNESFNALLDRQNTKRAEKYAFLYHGNKIPTARQIEFRKQQAQQKLLQSSDDSTALAIRPSQNLDDRPAGIDSFKPRQGARNSFMFVPDGIEDTHATVAQTAQDKSLAPPKSVSYAATRLPTTTASDPSSVPPSPSLSAIDAAIAGRPRPTPTDPGLVSNNDDNAGSATPRVAGYSFVSAEPTPSELGIPVSDEEADRLDRESAMSLFPKLDDPETTASGSRFTLQPASKRETLHLRMVDKQSSARRRPTDRLSALKTGRVGVGGGGGSATPGRTPTPSFASGSALGNKTPSLRLSSARGGNLTPAARMLAARIGGTKRTPGGGGGSGSGSGSLFGNTANDKTSASSGPSKNRVWTPTPLRGVKRS